MNNEEMNYKTVTEPGHWNGRVLYRASRDTHWLCNHENVFIVSIIQR